ncbi:hypothetical protein BpHYR1_003437 [Brachionus plicatilis]|uniref:Uncharacterized protein n=1 Tax=Brachionus plicatilis TaxID=10195 RepID=A0A3M7PPV7_BRAPC|nr:hypothetical protein BpHYR1_003437 [Brachionus plicatilis]
MLSAWSVTNALNNPSDGCRTAYFKLEWKKCEWFVKSIEYLGNVISYRSVRCLCSGASKTRITGPIISTLSQLMNDPTS